MTMSELAQRASVRNRFRHDESANRRRRDFLGDLREAYLENINRARPRRLTTRHAPLHGVAMTKRFHPLADVLPLIEGEEFDALVAEVKKCKRGAFTQLKRWLSEYDALFLRRNHADPMIVLPWRVWARLLERVRR